MVTKELIKQAVSAGFVVVASRSGLQRNPVHFF